MTNDKIIPIFFSTDDNYLPFLDVAVRSLIMNASRDYKYEIVVLNTGLNQEKTAKIKELEDENFSINFADISYAVDGIKSKLRNLYHFGLATYYRLFIQSLFPQYDRILYLDCDIVVLGDISKLYFTDLENKTIAGVVENYILRTPEFSEYTKTCVGIESKDYINAGIMLMDMNKIREQKIEEQFIYLINTYNFDTLDPDQAYINFLCRGNIKYLDFSWNREPIPEMECENPNIIHYALYKKPWQFDDVYLGEHFWKYAELSPFYNDILAIKENFDDEKKAKKEEAGREIIEHAKRIIHENVTFRKTLLCNN